MNGNDWVWCLCRSKVNNTEVINDITNTHHGCAHTQDKCYTDRGQAQVSLSHYLSQNTLCLSLSLSFGVSVSLSGHMRCLSSSFYIQVSNTQDQMWFCQLKQVKIPPMTKATHTPVFFWQPARNILEYFKLLTELTVYLKVKKILLRQQSFKSCQPFPHLIYCDSNCNQQGSHHSPHRHCTSFW